MGFKAAQLHVPGPISQNQHLLLSDFPSPLLFQWVSHFPARFLFSFSKQKLKCHLCHPFDISGLRYLFAHSFLDYWLYFGWIHSFGSARSVWSHKALWLLFHFDVHRGMWGGLEKSEAGCFATLPIAFLSPHSSNGKWNMGWTLSDRLAILTYETDSWINNNLVKLKVKAKEK